RVLRLRGLAGSRHAAPECDHSPSAGRGPPAARARSPRTPDFPLNRREWKGPCSCRAVSYVDFAHGGIDQDFLRRAFQQDRSLVEYGNARPEHAHELHVVIDDDDRRGLVDALMTPIKRSTSLPVMPAAGSSS